MNNPAPLISRFGFCLHLSLAVLALGSFPAAAVTRVVLMNAISEDNSYRSTLAAVDFSTALQAAMSSGAKEFEWVEREELDRAENEFKLSHLGFIDRAESVRCGRWAKADWAVLTRISTNMASGRSVDLEVVDLHRAESLGRTNLTINSPANGPFRVSSTDIARATSALRELMAGTHRTCVSRDSQKKIALLFFTSSGFREGEPDLKMKFHDALASLVATNPPMHLIQFQRAEVAMDEANLVLSGLAQMESNAWETVADQYVWGNCDNQRRKKFDRFAREWRDEQRSTVTLQVWDGKVSPKIVSFILTNAPSADSLAQEMARRTEPLLRQPGTNQLVERGRSQVSDWLVQEAIKKMTAHPNPSLGSRGGLQAWMDVVQILETACFFDPANRTARELWVRVRWGRAAKDAGGNEFFFARRRSEAWQKHVAQFGFKSAMPSTAAGWRETNSMAAEYILSAWRPVEMFRFSQYDQARWGVPRDAGGPEIWNWHGQFARELYERLAVVPEDPVVSAQSWDLCYGALAMDGGEFVLPDVRQRQRVLDWCWPHLLDSTRKGGGRFDDAYFRNLRLHFVAAGKPGEDRAWLSQLTEAASARAKENAARPVKLPRAEELDAGK